MAVQIGENLRGQVGSYTVVKQLGEGGFGKVFLAHGPNLVPIAIKSVREDLVKEAETRLLREIKILAGLHHPNIMPLLDWGYDQQGILWYAMPVMTKGTLADVIARQRSWDEVLGLLQGVATGLAVYHQVGGLHRDVKPENIFIADDGKPVLGDFGISRCPSITGSAATKSACGTEAYMAPEVWRKEGCQASDVYALGIVLWELANGKRHQVPATPPRFFNQGPGLESIQQLFEDMTNIDPKQRPGLVVVIGRIAKMRKSLKRVDKPDKGTSVWPYVLGGAAVVGVVALLAAALKGAGRK